MGYTVNYGLTIKVRQGKKHIRLYVQIALAAVLLSVAVVKHMWPEELQRVGYALFPWSQEMVQEAFLEFRENIAEGGAVGDAFSAFCKEILVEGDISE